MIGFDLLLHLRLDLLEILRGDSVRQFDIVIEPVLDRRAGGELRFRPDFQDGGGEDMRRRMTQPFDVGHLRALLGRFSFVVHKINFASFKALNDRNVQGDAGLANLESIPVL